MHKGLIIGAVAAAIIFSGGISGASMTTSVAYKVTVTIPESAGQQNGQTPDLALSRPEIQKSEATATITENSLRDHRPVVLQSIVVK